MIHKRICNVPIKYDDRALADNASMALLTPQIEKDKTDGEAKISKVRHAENVGLERKAQKYKGKLESNSNEHGTPRRQPARRHGVITI